MTVLRVMAETHDVAYGGCHDAVDHGEHPVDMRPRSAAPMGPAAATRAPTLRHPFTASKQSGNRRHLPCTSMHTAKYSKAKQPARSAQVYETVKRQLLAGDFPLGFRLGEVAIAEEIGVSRTPVREALSRLHAEGLVVRLPEGGFSPATPDLPTISELYEVRRGLEFTALHRGNHDRVMLEELRTSWRDLEIPDSDADCTPDFVLQDEDFHIRLATAAGNESLVDLLTGVNERIRVVRMHDFLTADRVEATVAEHIGILDALLDDDQAEAGSRLSSHLEISEHVVEQRAALVISRMIGRRRV